MPEPPGGAYGFELIYVSRARLPSRKAHVTQILKMCEALQAQGVPLELVHPYRVSPFELKDQSMTEFYNLKQNLRIRTLPSLDWPLLKRFSTRVWFLTYALTFTVIATLYVLCRRVIRGQPVVVLTRDRLTGLALLACKPLVTLPVFVSLHDYPRSAGTVLPFLWKRADGYVVNSHALETELLRDGYPREKIRVEPNAFDPDLFRISAGRRSLREELGFEPDRFLVGYTGHLYPWKGSETILGLAEAMPEVTFVTVGGGPEDHESMDEQRQNRGLQNLVLIPHRPHREIPRYLKAFDVLLLPTLPEQRAGMKYTSPLKLFEYMASGRPIVASDIAPIREILEHEHNALLAEPGSAYAFKRCIRRLLRDSSLRDRLGRQAFEDSKSYTWNKRADRILQFMEERLGQSYPVVRA